MQRQALAWREWGRHDRGQNLGCKTLATTVNPDNLIMAQQWRIRLPSVTVAGSGGFSPIAMHAHDASILCRTCNRCILARLVAGQCAAITLSIREGNSSPCQHLTASSVRGLIPFLRLSCERDAACQARVKTRLSCPKGPPTDECACLPQQLPAAADTQDEARQSMLSPRTCPLHQQPLPQDS